MDPPYSTRNVEYSDASDCIGQARRATGAEYFEAMELVFAVVERVLKDTPLPRPVRLLDSFDKEGQGFAPHRRCSLSALLAALLFGPVDHVAVGARANRPSLEKLRDTNARPRGRANFFLRGFQPTS
jgi:hypothetical protein